MKNRGKFWEATEEDARWQAKLRKAHEEAVAR